MAAKALLIALSLTGLASAQPPPSSPPASPSPPSPPPRPPRPPPSPAPPPYNTPPGEGDAIVGGNSCPVCYTQYYMKNVASPSYMPKGSRCARYENQACCTAEMAMKCGKISAKCEAFFLEEACLYECDSNVGRYRKYRDTCTDETGTVNAWQISAMPIKASHCDAWYEACKNDYFCSDETRSFFYQSDNLCLPGTSECSKTFGQIYANGTEMCEVLWDGSFKYEKNEANAYSLTFAYGQPNPNNRVSYPGQPTPQLCPFRPPFNSTTQCANDVANVLNSKPAMDALFARVPPAMRASPPAPGSVPAGAAAATGSGAGAAALVAGAVAAALALRA